MREPRWRGAKQLVGITSFGGDKTSEDRLHIFRDGKFLCGEFEDAEDDGSGRVIFIPTGWPGARYCMECRERGKEPEGQKRPSPYKMKPYGLGTGINPVKPPRFDQVPGATYETTLTERKRIARRPKKAARRQAKEEIVAVLSEEENG